MGYTDLSFNSRGSAVRVSDQEKERGFLLRFGGHGVQLRMRRKLQRMHEELRT